MQIFLEKRVMGIFSYITIDILQTDIDYILLSQLKYTEVWKALKGQ